jgi:type VII secretion protein EccB
MHTKRDRYQAHRFVVRRGIYALLHGEPDTPEAPLRWLGLAGIGGLAVVAVLVAVYGIIGLLGSGTSSAWRQPETLIVDRDTGTRNVLIDGVLHPVLNYASARLFLDASSFHTTLVAHSVLASVPHGMPMGISSAPDYLPVALVSAPWVVCGGQSVTADGAARATTELRIGTAPSGPALDSATAVLVVGGDGTRYLVWHGRRLRVTPSAVINALGYATQQPTAVGDSWLSAMPAGTDLAFPAVPGRGQSGPALGSQQTLVGQVVVVRTPGAGSSYYLVLGDGLAPLTPFAAALVLGDPASRNAYPGHAPAALPASAADVAASPRSGRSVVPSGYPAAIPRLVDAVGQAVCASFGDGASVDLAATVSVGVDSAASAIATDGIRGAGDTATADAVQLPAGRGLIARAVPAAHVTSGSVYLVTDLGIKYPLASVDVLPALGYSDDQPAPVSSTLLALIPTGPTMDPTAARHYQTP